MEPVKTGKQQADLRAELTVDEAWAEAVESVKLQVAIREAMAALARAEDAAAAGETGRAVRAELEMAGLARDAALKELDRASEAINAIEAAARLRRRHEARGSE
jgi:hypothetical protein